MNYKDTRYDIELITGWWILGPYSKFVLGYNHDVHGVIDKLKEVISDPKYGYQTTDKLNECISFLNKVKVAVRRHEGNVNCSEVERLKSLELIEDFKEEIEGYKKKWEIEEKQQPPQQFTKTLSEKQLEYLFNKLTENDVFLSKKDTDYSSFCYVFGGSMKPENFISLKWLQNVQLLRELLKPILYNYREYKIDVPPYFKKKKGEIINHLPSNKPTKNIFSRKIIDIHKGLTQTL